MNIPATYGHGTENDFVIVFDPDNNLVITPEQTAAICDRATGIGADGLIRTTKKDGRWFMDYRNADGSLAEMCGNGIRVMAKYLVAHGHQNEGIFAIDSRDGVKHLRVPAEGDITVNIGKVEEVEGRVSVTANGKTWNGYNIDVGNPHAVVFVDSLDEVGDLKTAPIVTPEEDYPEGVNVEFVELVDEREVKMRVFERGVGETRSCGTGTCAVALASSLYQKTKLPATWSISPPGGTLSVEIDPHFNAILTGPAVLVRDVDISSYLVK